MQISDADECPNNEYSTAITAPSALLQSNQKVLNTDICQADQKSILLFIKVLRQNSVDRRSQKRTSAQWNVLEEVITVEKKRMTQNNSRRRFPEDSENRCPEIYQTLLTSS